ncbi:Trichome differentiation protein GL1 [Entamoeba marina]
MSQTKNCCYILGISSKEIDINQKKPRKKAKNWSKDEDNKLLTAVDILGDTNWVEIAKYVGTRSRKQCRERYINHVSPKIDKRKWTKEEDEIIMNTYQLVGGKWCIINRKLEGRTARSVRNRFKTLTSKLRTNSCFCVVNEVDYFVVNGGNPW